MILKINLFFVPNFVSKFCVPIFLLSFHLQESASKERVVRELDDLKRTKYSLEDQLQVRPLIKFIYLF